MEKSNVSRYVRQEIFAGIGKDGQEKIKKGRVAIIEMSSIGAAVANDLARSGVGYLRLIDGDYIEPAELQRQTLFTEEEAGKETPKAIAACEYLRTVNSEIEIEPVISDVNSGTIDNLIEDVDLVIDATDSMEVRLLLNEACHHLKKPWIYGGTLASSGMTMNVLPGEDRPCLKCFLGDEQDDTGEQPTCATVGILNSAASIVAALQSAEALKILIGSDDVRRELVTFDVWENYFEFVPVEKDPDCPVCGKKDYTFYGKVSGSRTATMCGKNSVQVIPQKDTEVNFEKYAEKLSSQGSVKYTQYTLDFSDGNIEIKLFKNGRAIIKNVNDEKKAKAVYAEYIGL